MQIKFEDPLASKSLQKRQKRTTVQWWKWVGSGLWGEAAIPVILRYLQPWVNSPHPVRVKFFIQLSTLWVSRAPVLHFCSFEQSHLDWIRTICDDANYKLLGESLLRLEGWHHRKLFSECRQGVNIVQMFTSLPLHCSLIYNPDLWWNIQHC